jgi:hypothetical protein
VRLTRAAAQRKPRAVTPQPGELIEHVPVLIENDPRAEPLRMLSCQLLESLDVRIDRQALGRGGHKFVLAVEQEPLVGLEPKDALPDLPSRVVE